MTIHKLKLSPIYYDDSASGIKTFEIRNADRKPEPPRKPSCGVMREEDIAAMDRKRKAQDMVAFVTAEEEKPGLKRARALKMAMVTVALCADFECVMRFRLRDKRTGEVYEHGEL